MTRAELEKAAENLELRKSRIGADSYSAASTGSFPEFLISRLVEQSFLPSHRRALPAAALRLEVTRDGEADVFAPRGAHDLQADGQVAVGGCSAADDHRWPPRAVERAGVRPAAARRTEAAGRTRIGVDRLRRFAGDGAEEHVVVFIQPSMRDFVSSAFSQASTYSALEIAVMRVMRSFTDGEKFFEPCLSAIRL